VATVRLLDLGRRPYREVWALQRSLHAAVAEGRAPDTWLVVEHDPVITLGRRARADNVLDARGVDVVEIERGGDVTYHGPGQLVVYPIRKLARFREVVPFVSALERAVIAALATFGVTAAGRKEHRGVYVHDDAICAVGLAVQKMTSLHGLALNANTALDYDRLITPCGTPEFGITSISRELGRDVSWAEARDVVLPALEAEFGLQFDREAATAPLLTASR
jgi:lipoyl(octanoyl) transferase